VCNDISTMKFKLSQQVESFMGNDTRFQCKNKQNINAIESTDERITSRTGLALFAGGI
jgi:hypothetical protein